jgi:hypothetical protein
MERLTSFTSPEITAAALEGFAACLRRSDIPSPHMIGETELEGKAYLTGLPILAGLSELTSNSVADLLLLPQAMLQSGLAFHHAIISDREREWVKPVIEALPDLAAEALMTYWRPLLAKNTKYIHGLYDLAYKELLKPIAQRASLPLLKDFPNCQEENLFPLLHSAIRNGDRHELLTHAQQTLSRHALTVENRTLWCAAAFALDYQSVKDQLTEQASNKEQAVRILSFLCSTRGSESETPYPLPREALVLLIITMGRIFDFPVFPDRGWSAIHNPDEAASAVRSLIRRLGKDLSRESSLALAELHASSGLDSWREEIAYVIEDQTRHRREQAFRYPTITQVTKTLNQGPPANAADLQALVHSHLHAIHAELRDGPTDGWKGMWNVDSNEKPTKPRPENICRDRLLDSLRPRLFPVGVAAEPEGHYAEDKRADVKAIAGPLNLPVEIKRHMHPEIWTAPRDQLKKLYARDPGTAGRGIYLVLWFGLGAGAVPKHPKDIAQIQTASQLEVALCATLQPPESELVEIMVIDCEPPGKLG